MMVHSSRRSQRGCLCAAAGGGGQPGGMVLHSALPTFRLIPVEFYSLPTPTQVSSRFRLRLVVALAPVGVGSTRLILTLTPVGVGATRLVLVLTPVGVGSTRLVLTLTPVVAQDLVCSAPSVHLLVRLKHVRIPSDWYHFLSKALIGIVEHSVT